jgi:hypothetical protein
MAVERSPATASLVDVLDRVIDRGIMVDPWARGSARGISVAEGSVRAEVESQPPEIPLTRGARRSRTTAS